MHFVIQHEKSTHDGRITVEKMSAKFCNILSYCSDKIMMPVLTTSYPYNNRRDHLNIFNYSTVAHEYVIVEPLLTFIKFHHAPLTRMGWRICVQCVFLNWQRNFHISVVTNFYLKSDVKRASRINVPFLSHGIIKERFLWTRAPCPCGSLLIFKHLFPFPPVSRILMQISRARIR